MGRRRKLTLLRKDQVSARKVYTFCSTLSCTHDPHLSTGNDQYGSVAYGASLWWCLVGCRLGRWRWHEGGLGMGLSRRLGSLWAHSEWSSVCVVWALETVPTVVSDV